MPDAELRRMLCDPAGYVRCPTCAEPRPVHVMRAKHRDPLVACMLLACDHAWHVQFDGLTPASDARPCDCL
jgi:hypothetical protein